MTTKEKLDKVLELQEKGITSNDIADSIGVSSGALRSFMNRQGYKSINGKFVLKEDDINQISIFNESPKKESTKKTKAKKTEEPKIDSKKEENKKSTKVQKTKTEKVVKENPKKDVVKNEKIKETIKKEKINKPRKVVKSNAKVNLTQEDMDKLCEVYDWYLSIKDMKSLNPKKKSSRDLIIEEQNKTDLKTTTIKVDKNMWEDFERLCSNSEHSKQAIIGQAIKDYLKDNKHLL